MNNLICKCGHAEKEHTKSRYIDGDIFWCKFCVWSVDYVHSFQPDNLKYLEQQYAAKEDCNASRST